MTGVQTCALPISYARFSELQINLPQAQGDNAKEMPERINVSVDERGTYAVNNNGLALASVETLAQALKDAAGGEQADPVVVISADAHASHQSVVRVMEAARIAGYPRVTFVTQSTASE